MDTNLDTVSTSSTGNYIIDTIIKIDKMQKEAVINEASPCITCQNSLITFTNNTLPVSLILKGGDYLETYIGTTTTETIYYRIEAIRCEQYVTLRQLELADGELVATNYTLILDANCICGIECHTPIQATSCNLD